MLCLGKNYLNEDSICMKKASTIFLRIAIVCLGIGAIGVAVLLLTLWNDIGAEFPNATYAVYVVFSALIAAVVPFVIGLYAAWRLLNYIDKSMPFTKGSANAVKTIAIAAGSASAICIAALPFYYIWAQVVDAPGLMAIGTVLAGGSMVVAVFGSLLYRLLSEAADLQSESELTV